MHKNSQNQPRMTKNDILAAVGIKLTKSEVERALQTLADEGYIMEEDNYYTVLNS